MPIEGPVEELALADLLQLLHLSRRTGELSVRAEDGTRVALLLETGALTGARAGDPELRLGRLLQRAGKVEESQIQRALERQRRSGVRRIGELLLEQGAVAVSDVERALRFQIEEVVLDLMRWRNGELRFEESLETEPGAIEIRLPVDAILMDAARRLDELNAVVPEDEGDPLPRLALGAA